jgi:hypothetical protein
MTMLSGLPLAQLHQQMAKIVKCHKNHYSIFFSLLCAKIPSTPQNQQGGDVATRSRCHMEHLASPRARWGKDLVAQSMDHQHYPHTDSI